jgi:hypothetical protein
VERGTAGDGESRKERLDRELIELLNELRVAIPGVQVLFAFLLTAVQLRLCTSERRATLVVFRHLHRDRCGVGVPDGADVVSPSHIP